MRNSRKLYPVALASAAVILFLILVSSTVSAASPTVTETRITTNDSAQMAPAIYGDRIVWTDSRNGFLNEYGNFKNLDIYTYNISTSKETQITANGSNQSMPAIYKNRIVWIDDRNGKYDLYMYDISTSQETRITTSGSVYFGNAPAIYGDRIVWTDTRNGNEDNWDEDIYMYDLSTHKETPIATYESSQSSPAIYRDRIVWTDFRYGHDEGQSSIFMYDLSTNKETQITNNGSDHVAPAIYGDKLVYSNAEISEIFMYDLSTHEETQITTNISSSNPVIYGNRIVWWDSRNENWDIYMYDLSTHKETQITTDKSDQISPMIYSDRIVWTDARNGYLKDDIYMCTLSGSEPTPKPPVADFSATPLSGKVPLKVKFTSTSTGSPTSWKWNFGDGSALVTEQNPVHTYSTAGIYTVKHTVSNTAGKDTEIKTNCIKVGPTSPKAVFSAYPNSGYAPFKVAFTDKSTGSPTTWKWNFGDGTYSTSKNPTHTYSKAGKYTAILTVKNAAGSNTVTKSGYINVATLKAPVAAFSASPVSGKAPLKVQFTDKSANSPASWKWSFGDGTYSTSKNPLHTYSKAGKYTVYLTAKNAKGSNTKIMSGYIVISK